MKLLFLSTIAIIATAFGTPAKAWNLPGKSEAEFKRTPILVGALPYGDLRVLAFETDPVRRSFGFVECFISGRQFTLKEFILLMQRRTRESAISCVDLGPRFQANVGLESSVTTRIESRLQTEWSLAHDERFTNLGFRPLTALSSAIASGVAVVSGANLAARLGSTTVMRPGFKIFFVATVIVGYVTGFIEHREIMRALSKPVPTLESLFESSNASEGISVYSKSDIQKLAEQYFELIEQLLKRAAKAVAAEGPNA